MVIFSFPAASRMLASWLVQAQVIALLPVGKACCSREAEPSSTAAAALRVAPDFCRSR